MIELTRDQHDTLAANGSGPAKVIDPITNAEYVLVSAEEFARLDRSGWIDEDFHVSDTYRAVAEAFAEGWDHPRMADYDRYEDLKK